MISFMIAMEGDRLQLQNHGLSINDAKALAAALSCNESVTHVNLSGNPLGVGAVSIGTALGENEAMIRLDIRSAQVFFVLQRTKVIVQDACLSPK